MSHSQAAAVLANRNRAQGVLRNWSGVNRRVK